MCIYAMYRELLFSGAVKPQSGRDESYSGVHIVLPNGGVHITLSYVY